MPVTPVPRFMSTSPASRDATPDVSQIDAILSPVLGAAGARARREMGLKKDTRSQEEVSRTFVDLDALIDAYIAHLQGHGAPVPLPALPVIAKRRPTDGTLPVVAPVVAPVRDLPVDVPSAPMEALKPELDDFEGVVAEADAPPIPMPLTRPKPKVVPRPPLPEVDVKGPIIPAGASDTTSVELLYQDIIFLVEMDDWGGALISLERLLVMAQLDGQVKVFIDANEVKLLNLYESYLGPFNKVPKFNDHKVDNFMPSAYRRIEKLAALIELIDGKRNMNKLFKVSPYSPLETCSAINQLRRSGIIEV